jgi:hypothetical protein
METLYVANSRLENLGSGLDLGLFVGIFDTSILSNTFIKDVEMSAWTAGAVFESHDNGLVKNVTISNCNFNNNKAHSVHFDFFDTSSIQNIVVTQSAFLGSELGILVTGAGNIGSLDVNYCNFTAQTDRGVNSYVAVVDTFNLSNNTFIGSGGFALFSRTQQGTVANNQFSGSIREVPVFMTTPATSTAFWAILNNTFTGPSEVPTGPGYAAFIGNTAGSSMLCLDFFNNISTPTMDQTLSAYEFDNGAAGTFNITPRSTQANNIGKINTDGTIGSCSP